MEKCPEAGRVPRDCNEQENLQLKDAQNPAYAGVVEPISHERERWKWLLPPRRSSRGRPGIND